MRVKAGVTTTRSALWPSPNLIPNPNLNSPPQPQSWPFREAAATLEAEAVGKITLMGTLKRSLLLPPICALYTWMFMQVGHLITPPSPHRAATPPPHRAATEPPSHHLATPLLNHRYV